MTEYRAAFATLLAAIAGAAGDQMTTLIGFGVDVFLRQNPPIAEH